MNIKGRGHSLTLVQGHSDSTFSNFFPWETASRLKPNFIWILDGMGEWQLVQTVQVTWPRWSPCPYMVKTWKNLLCNQKADDLESWYAASGTWVLPSSNDDSGFTLTYFMARSNFVPYAFVWEEDKTMDFSETIVVYDIKVGRCSQLNEYMKLMSTEGHGHSLTVVQISQIQYF